MYEIFEKLLKEKNLSLVEFSRLTGIPKTTLYDWKNGKFQLKDSKRRVIADYFGVTLDYLDGLSPYRNDSDLNKDIERMEERIKSKGELSDEVASLLKQNRELRKALQTKPLYRASAGQGAYNGTYADETIVAEEGFEYATVVGDSMLPELRDGDIVKIQMQAETTAHDYTLVKVDGEHATIKFVEIVNNGVWLRALNKEVFEDKFYSVQEVMTLPVTIIGKVVSFERKL